MIQSRIVLREVTRYYLKLNNHKLLSEIFRHIKVFKKTLIFILFGKDII